MIFHLPNEVGSPMKGFQLKTMVVSENGWQDGMSEPFDALVDSGALHTCVSDTIMRNILEKVYDKNRSRLEIAGFVKAGGVYGAAQREPVYILPRVFLGRIHLTNVAVTVLRNSNIDCLIGRSILHQCILTLNPEDNTMTFDFKDSLKPLKHLVDGLLPFESVELFTESNT